MIQEYDYLFKLVIIGNSAVGKSSLLLRFAVNFLFYKIKDDSFSESYLTTIGVDFRFRTLPIDGKNVKLQIWDTAGQERFRTITNAYYKGADAIVLVYDITNQSSFDDIEKYWINEVESYAEPSVELLLIGNKSDMVEEKAVDTTTVKNYTEKRKMLFYEASAKTADSVNAAFINIAKKLMSRKDKMAKESGNTTQTRKAPTRPQPNPGNRSLNSRAFDNIHRDQKKGECCK